MVFAQLTYLESPETLNAVYVPCKEKLYHLGIRGNNSGNTIAGANETREWRIYCDFAQILIQQIKRLYLNDRLLESLHDFIDFILELGLITKIFVNQHNIIYFIWGWEVFTHHEKIRK